MTRRTGAKLLITLCAFGLSACGGGGGSGENGQDGSNSHPPQNAVTRTFDLTGFTEVEIRNSFSFIVQQGDHFAIEMTVDADDIDLVRVNLDGVRLRVEFDPSHQGDIRTDVARGIITLPSLDLIELSGSAFADVAGFQASFLTVMQSGSSHIVGSNNRFDFVTASLTGSSHLAFADSAPVPAAHIETHGSTQATLAVMNDGTLTGTANDSSNISYYGNSVAVRVSTFGSASVTWLGPNNN